MSKWIELGMVDKIAGILSDVVSDKPENLFGKPMMTPYQIAFEYWKKFPDDTKALHLQLGGSGVGVHNSLAHFISVELAKDIKHGTAANIEGVFLSESHLKKIVFEFGGELVDSTHADYPYDLSMFRLKVGPSPS